MKKADIQRLGHRQQSCLRSLYEFGSWDDSGLCGWTWSTRSETTRIMESLCSKGLALKEGDGRVKYRISKPGIRLLRSRGETNVGK